MSIELRPLGVACNLRCSYCYQEPQRTSLKQRPLYDMDLMKAALDAKDEPFTLFGGEALLIPLSDLEELWSWGYARFGGSSVQTNGVLMSADHIALIRKYNVKVGISVDGPDELNDLRWHATLANTRVSTAKTHSAIRQLCELGLPPGLIVTLHRGNAAPNLLPRLGKWFVELERLGIRSVNLHLLESESAEIRAAYALTTEENIDALSFIWKLSDGPLSSLRIGLFDEMRQMLLANDRRTTCVWYGCDPYTTSAVQGVEGHGETSNCGRTNKDGVDFQKTSTPGFERYLSLYKTPQSCGGCGDCKFFLVCKGQCPGTAIENDWRNRSEHCLVWFAIYQRIEEQLLTEGLVSLSVHPSRKEIEEAALQLWAKGNQVSLHTICLERNVTFTTKGSEQP